jgi:DNA-binding CsgD family transcriptional regulator
VVPEAMHHPAVSADRIALLEDLRRLSPRQRAVLVLRYFDNLTEADTAAALGISVGTVKSHVRDALARLRTQPSGEEQSAATRETHGPTSGSASCFDCMRVMPRSARSLCRRAADSERPMPPSRVYPMTPRRGRGARSLFRRITCITSMRARSEAHTRYV